MIYLKLLFQEIWRAGTSWDDEIGDKQLVKWRNWLQLLVKVESVRIPRCYHVSPSVNEQRTIELHTFVDASELSYAAVCYLRRGTPLQIISDRGTNLVGASKELKTALDQVDSDKVVREFTTTSTSWIFNPPASPHMGGIWERMIQTVKKILEEIKPKRLLSDEVLRNLMAEIENIVNSRPLTHVPVDGESSLAPPQHRTIFWLDHRTVLANYFWKRWVNEYTPIITRREKWFSAVKAIAVGDIVIVVDPNFPRNCWPKGSIVAVKVSKDGQVRSATVQTAAGIYERPAVKSAVLDIGANRSMLDQGPTTGGDCCERPSSVSAP
ncbi:uncharacterized protein LOC129729179 [Wyeomyia smithii]|uniref:uncharacterized protein LOC129729179 n=1 Tax=Wyeomyia smithii TaxID=174621 RepID=UPI002467EB8E|nr:uncharacterized protein LOC129729179 [Wyeomyia smithii]